MKRGLRRALKHPEATLNRTRECETANFLVMVRALKVLVIMTTIAMMLWSVGTANATSTDIDGDGLKNGVERNVTHTNPHKADTDEGKVGTQIMDADSDNDGIEDSDEDSDGDGTDNEDEDDQGEDEQ
jgi:Bacterial TSP3 repeat